MLASKYCAAASTAHPISTPPSCIYPIGRYLTGRDGGNANLPGCWRGRVPGAGLWAIVKQGTISCAGGIALGLCGGIQACGQRQDSSSGNSETMPCHYLDAAYTLRSSYGRQHFQLLQLALYWFKMQAPTHTHTVTGTKIGALEHAGSRQCMMGAIPGCLSLSLTVLYSP